MGNRHTVEWTHQATAASATLATNSKTGDTTPGAKNVPIPGYSDGVVDRVYTCDGRSILPDSSTFVDQSCLS